MAKNADIEDPPGSQNSEVLAKNKGSYQSWMSSLGFSRNPFSFEILPEALVGYKQQTAELEDAVLSGNKIILLLGPTGSGKTTVLKWLSKRLAGTRHVIYLPKPPLNPDNFIDILNPYFESGFFRKKRAKSIYQLPEFIAEQQKRRKMKYLLIICDEAHEASDEVLKWMRVLGDNVDGMVLILAALPRFERDLGERLETLRKRISVKIGVLSLTKEETLQLIDRRMAHAGGKNIFTQDAIDYIYEQSTGFPREILRLCDSAMRKAHESGAAAISRSIIEEPGAMQPMINASSVPEKQRHILEALVNPAPISHLADLFAGRYKSKQHALRAINNILHRLMKAGLVERNPFEKSYVYKLSSRAKTAFVTR
ncbi:MAG: AAA family ATPase [Candidatus Aenigmarchaeota archaeon]|nr:AAA family ATPase [Candidatus Aenigmarchaeota archaeon]